MYVQMLSMQAVRSSLCLALFDPLQYFSWGVYLCAATIYSALVFQSELSRENGPHIFSKRNARSLSQIIVAHLAFLSTLLGLIWIASYIYPILPKWIIDTFVSRGSSYSALDIVIIIAMIIMQYLERQWLFVDRATDPHEVKRGDG